MFELRESETFKTWREGFSDKRVRLMIATRLDRLSKGHAGDAKPVGNGISELRLDYGPGYRIYYQRRGATLLLLLCGGDKDTQAKNIAAAKRIAKDWSNDNG